MKVIKCKQCGRTSIELSGVDGGIVAITMSISILGIVLIAILGFIKFIEIIKLFV